MSPMVSITTAGVIAQRADGVITETVKATAPFGDVVAPTINNWVIVQDSESAFDLFIIKNGIAYKSDYSFLPYDVKSNSGVPAIFFDFVAQNGAPVFPQETARFICQCFVFSKYPGIDCNSAYVEARGITNDWCIVVGTNEEIRFNEEGY